MYRVRALEDLEHTEMKRGDLLAFYENHTEFPHVLTRHVRIDSGILLVGLNTGKLEPIILTHGGAAVSSSRAAVEQAVAATLRPQLRLVRSMG